MKNEKINKFFIESFENILNDMCELKVQWDGEGYEETSDMKSFGALSIVSFIGEFKGRFYIDIEGDFAKKLSSIITDEECSSLKDNILIASISEFNNIVSGDAITKINNEYSYKLRLAPPVVLTGKDIYVALPKITTRTFNGSTEFGNLKVNIGLEGEV